MAWAERWVGVLTWFGAGALGLLGGLACEEVEPPEPSWMPWYTIEGRFRPEVVPPAIPVPAGDRLRIVTYNTCYGIEVDELAAKLRADPDLAAADVLLLQEGEYHPVAGTSEAALLGSALGMGHVYVPITPLDGGSRGLVILSRAVLRDVEVMYLRDVADVDVDDAARSAVRAIIDTPRGPLTLIDVHLNVRLNIADRLVQLRSAVIDEPTPVVAGGDFNTNDYVWGAETIPLLSVDAVADTSQAEALDDYMRALGFDTPSAGFGPTWHWLSQQQRLDSIFTRGLATGAGGVARHIELSDHWPLWIDVDVRRP